MGSLATADLLQAVDSPLQDGAMDWNALAPMTSLMSAGDVLVQYDQAYERYDTPIPQQLAADLAVTPPGLTDPVSYGAPVPNVPLIPHFDEATLARPPNQGWPAPLVSYTVTDPRPIVRTESTKNPVVIDGDASGIVNAASVGLLAGNPGLLYAGTLDTNRGLRSATLGAPADLVVTDTNRKRGFEWNSLNENTGYTETATQPPDTADPSDEPLNLFPKAPADAQTTAQLQGVSSVTASSYGSSITYLPEDRPAAALDGNAQTAWTDDPFSEQLGQWWQVVLLQPRTVSSLTLLQPQTGDPDRFITRATLSFDGGSPVPITLGPSSRTPPGQLVTFPARTFTTLRITVTGVGEDRPSLPVASRSSIGFAEVGIPGITANETIAMPEDLLRAAGGASAIDRVTLVMTRLRSSGTPPRTDVEPWLARTFWLPTQRTFSMTGSARISPLIPDDMIDRLVGRPGSDHTGIVAYSLGRLPGDLNAGAIATLDGDSSTLWEPGFGASHQAGEWLQYMIPKPITFDHLNLQIAADGQHSVPTRLTVSTDSGSTTFDLPHLADSPVPGSVVDVPVSFPPLTGQSIRITVDAAAVENTPNYYSKAPIGMPLGIAEVGIPGLSAAPVPATIPSSCRDDLITVDGAPVWVSVTGSTSAALARQPLTISLCGPDAGGLTLGPGDHTLRSSAGQTTGFDVDQLALDSAPGGAAMPLASPAVLAAPTVSPSPAVRVVDQTATTVRLSLHGVTAAPGQPPIELVLGQSINAGWKASVVGGDDLGRPVLIDGFANGWRLDPSSLGSAIHDGSISVVLRWQPQQEVNVALIVSLVAIVGCVVLAALPLRRRRRRRGRHSRTSDPVEAVSPTPSDAAPNSHHPVLVGPRLAVPFRAEGRRAPVWVALVTGLLSGSVAAVIAAPLVGLAAGVATTVVLLVPRLRVLLGLAAIAGIVAAGGYTAAHQATEHIPVSVNGSWPIYFGTASRLAWVGVIFLGADAVVGVVLRRRSAVRSAPDGDAPDTA